MSRSSRNSEKRSSRNDFYRGDNNATERRTLFNPESDNPVAFNAKSEDNISNRSGTNQRSYSSQRRRHGLEQQQQQQRSAVPFASYANRTSDERSSLSSPGRSSRGVLWDPNSKTVPQSIQPPLQQQQQKKKSSSPHELQHSQNVPNTITTTSASTSTAVDTSFSTNKRSTSKDEETMTPEAQEHRMQLKLLLARVQKLQVKITQVDESASADHPYFQGMSLESNGISSNSNQQRRRRHKDNTADDDDDAFLFDRHPSVTNSLPPAMHPWLTMTLDSPLWQSTEYIWKDKMQLHLQLADAYLNIIQYDDGFAETNHLTSLCWKRAIYSLVEQFRQAFARQQTLAGVAAAITTTASNNDGSSSQPIPTTMLENDSDMDDDEVHEGDLVPVMTETGMTMMPLSDSEDDDNGEMDKVTLQQITAKHLVMLRMWMETFLLVADGYYQRAMVVLRDLDNKDDAHDDGDLERSLHNWRRTRRWKWYRCIPYRGDLARYRFIYGQNKGDYALAWRWYSLGVWMIPATGRFYFHQFLLLNSPQYSPLYELHKLYFGVRSLMVRRNGFVNAREGLVALFENNRQWYATTIAIKTGNNKAQRRRQQQRQRREPLQNQDRGNGDGSDPMMGGSDATISGLFICLHGMLFTKINLDVFSQAKRRYFETLFPSTTKSVTANAVPDSPALAAHEQQQQQTISTTLSCQHLFWLETIILNLSSLYGYDYASSTLTKALTMNKVSWVAKSKKDGDGNNTLPQHQQQRNDDWEDALEALNDSPLFGHSIDMICQVVVELVSRFLNNTLEFVRSPALPALPPVELNLRANESLFFGTEDQATTKTDGDTVHTENDTSEDRSWLIYIYVLLHWMVVTGIGVDGAGGDKSIWERVIGQVATKSSRATSNNMDKITCTFWPLLMAFLTKLLQELPEAQRYQVIDRHLLDTNNPWATDEQHDSGAWDDYIMHLMGPSPVLLEDDFLRGLGWLDQALSNDKTNYKINGSIETTTTTSMDLQRRIRILDYGFTLVKQMHQALEYDPVEEAFLVKPSLTPLLDEGDQEIQSPLMLDEEDDTDILPILTAMDDAVLFDSTNGLTDHGMLQDADDEPSLHDSDDGMDDDNDMMGQLKKRRQHLQSMLATMTEEKRHAATYGYQKLTMQGRGKEREAKLNRIREKVIPGQTVLVLDTNCFIGHMDAIRKLIQGGAWSIVIPLVVITELDGLKGNAAPLGTVADQALQLIETALASKQTRPDAIRIQTSHHNFMYDISIRSEQFIFGETDKNLDDLILSTCLWWNNNKKQRPSVSGSVPVCLVTADRNLSVKARARDVQVIPVSGLMKIRPPIPSLV